MEMKMKCGKLKVHEALRTGTLVCIDLMVRTLTMFYGCASLVFIHTYCPDPQHPCTIPYSYWLLVLLEIP